MLWLIMLGKTALIADILQKKPDITHIIWGGAQSRAERCIKHQVNPGASRIRHHPLVDS